MSSSSGIAKATELRATGKTLRQIGAEIGVSDVTVGNWLKAEKACQCGCGGMTRSRFVFGHHTRLAQDYEIDPATGCWLWLGTRNRKGYGELNRDGRKTTAHRYYYERAKGPVPEGLELDHLCHVKACVNPAHLEAVTAATNSQRRRSSKLRWEDVRAIRASGLGPTAVARQWGVSVSNASMVLRGATWRDDS